jgi:hypothetical protein
VKFALLGIPCVRMLSSNVLLGWISFEARLFCIALTSVLWS